MRWLVYLFESDFLRRIDHTIPDENSYSGSLRGKVIYTATNNIIENWFVRWFLEMMGFHYSARSVLTEFFHNKTSSIIIQGEEIDLKWVKKL
jgi:hypothetical protein